MLRSQRDASIMLLELGPVLDEKAIAVCIPTPATNTRCRVALAREVAITELWSFVWAENRYDTRAPTAIVGITR